MNDAIGALIALPVVVSGAWFVVELLTTRRRLDDLESKQFYNGSWWRNQ